MFGSKRQKPRQFNYKPRFFDLESEEMAAAKMAKGIYDEEDAKKYVPGSYIKNRRAKRMVIDENNNLQKRRSMMVRAIIFLVLLLAATYFIINFAGFEIIAKSFMQK